MAENPITLIEARALPTAVRGYDRRATDDLFEELKKIVTTLTAEYAAARSRVEELEGRFAALEAREKEIAEALVVASRVRTDSERAGKERAGEHIRAAEAEAERIVAEARAKARSFEDEARDVEQLALGARQQLTTYLRSLLDEIERRGADAGSVVHDLVERAGDAGRAGA